MRFLRYLGEMPKVWQEKEATDGRLGWKGGEGAHGNPGQVIVSRNSVQRPQVAASVSYTSSIKDLIESLSFSVFFSAIISHPHLRARVHVFERNVAGSSVETLMSSSTSFFSFFLLPPSLPSKSYYPPFSNSRVIALKRRPRQTSRVTYKRSGSPTSFYASFNCSTAIHRWRRDICSHVDCKSRLDIRHVATTPCT